MSGIYQSTRQWMQLNGQQLTFTTASTTNSAAIPSGATGVRITANQACWVEVASSATAVLSSYLPANVVEYIAVGGGNSISAVGATTAGTLFIKPLVG